MIYKNRKNISGKSLIQSY